MAINIFLTIHSLFIQYVTQCNKDLNQRAKPKSDSVASPFRELQQLDQDKKVIHKIRPISPVHQSLSEASISNELREMKSTAQTEGSVAAVRAEAKGDRQWKEMKLRLDDLPGILARLSKIKLTGTPGSFFFFTSVHPV